MSRLTESEKTEMMAIEKKLIRTGGLKHLEPKHRKKIRNRNFKLWLGTETAAWLRTLKSLRFGFYVQRKGRG